MICKRKKNKIRPTRIMVLLIVVIALIGLTRTSFYHSMMSSLNVKVVEIKIGPDVKIVPAVPKDKFARCETFTHMIDRLHPYAAINGTFYNEKLKPLGDILIDGKLVNRGHYRNAIAISRSEQVEFIRLGKHGFDWSKYRSGLASGPMLVRNGKVTLNPNKDGFTRKSLSLKAWRSGIGLSKTGKLMMVTAKEPLTLKEFAELMLSLGARDAMNLDGGSACGLYREGKMLSYPSIPMTNMLIVLKKNEK